MNKKLGPLPIWMWAAVGVTLAYIAWKFSQNQSEPEVEGYYPAERAEPSEAPVESSGLGGLAQLGEAISGLAAAGFVPAGSEEAQALAPERELVTEELSDPLRELLSEQIKGLRQRNQALAKRLRKGQGGKGKGAKGKGAKGKGAKGKGAKGKGAKGKGAKSKGAKGNAGKSQGAPRSLSRQPSSRAPRHTARPNHAAARAPRRRAQAVRDRRRVRR